MNEPHDEVPALRDRAEAAEQLMPELNEHLLAVTGIDHVVNRLIEAEADRDHAREERETAEASLVRGHENEAELLKRFSDVLSEGNASDWGHVFDALQQLTADLLSAREELKAAEAEITRMREIESDELRAQRDDTLRIAAEAKLAREELATLKVQKDQGVGLCSHCDFEVRYEVGGEAQTTAAHQLAEHAATCMANPKVQRIATLEAELARLQPYVHQLEQEVQKKKL